MEKILKVAIIGCGGIARSHAEAYNNHPNVKLVACCDLLEDKARAFAEKYEIGAYYTDYRELFEKEDLDAVSITTWNSAHKPIAIDALRAGLNVLCEKPMALNTAEALEMERAANETGKLLQIGFVRRFESTSEVIRNFYTGGTLGDVYYAKAQYLRRNGCPGGWFGDKSFSGGGPLIDLGVHVIDLVRYLTGRPMPVSVYGYTFDNLGRNRAKHNIPKGGYKRDYEFAGKFDFRYTVEDFAGADIRFDNGLVLHVEASFNLNLKDNVGKIELFGTKSALQLDDHVELYGVVDDYYMNMTPQGLAKNERVQMFQGEIEHFADCCLNGTPCLAPAEDGVVLMKILDAIYESARTHRSVEIR